MAATMTTAIEMIEFACELGERFPDQPDWQVIENVEEAFELQYDEILAEDRVLSRVVLYAYVCQDVEKTKQWARRSWHVNL